MIETSLPVLFHSYSPSLLLVDHLKLTFAIGHKKLSKTRGSISTYLIYFKRVEGAQELLNID